MVRYRSWSRVPSCQRWRNNANIPLALSIVFVHGLQGHPKNTWSCKVSSSPDSATTKETRNPFRRLCSCLFPKDPEPPVTNEGSNEIWVFWPADLLPKDCPAARILTWGYDSKVCNFFDGPASQNNIYAHAKNLWFALGRNRRRCVRYQNHYHIPQLWITNKKSIYQQGRALIFVAHSLGGMYAHGDGAIAYRDSMSDADVNTSRNNCEGCLFALYYVDLVG